MNKLNRDKKWLLEYLEHVTYEIDGLVSSYLKMTKLEVGGAGHPFGADGEKNDCLDLMALHFRNLYEFFCYKSNPDYVRAADYIPGFAGTSNSLLISKANNQVAHLTVERHEYSKTYESKSWDPNLVMKWMVENLEKWKDGLEAEHVVELDERLEAAYQFVDWYKKQIYDGAV